MKLEDTERHADLRRPSRVRLRPGILRCVAGIGMFAPTGELAGAAVIDGNNVTDLVRHDDAVLGRILRFMTVSLAYPAGRRARQQDAVHAGSVVDLDHRRRDDRRSGRPGRGDRRREAWRSPTSFPARARSRPAPWSRSAASGFNSGTRLRLEGTRHHGRVGSSSATEMQFTLAEAANMTGAASSGSTIGRSRASSTTRTCAASRPRRAAGRCSRRPSRFFPA